MVSSSKLQLHPLTHTSVMSWLHCTCFH